MGKVRNAYKTGLPRLITAVAAACVFAVFLLFAALNRNRGAAAAEQTEMADSGLDYTESTDELENPERGFYKSLSARLTNGSSGAYWTESYLEEYARSFGLLHLRFGLEAYSSNAPLSVENERVTAYGSDGPIGESALNSLRETFKNIRAAGKTAIIRFSYNVNGYKESTDSGKRYVQAEPDGGMELIESHIRQLGEVLAPFGDVIAAVETGMFGPWGEQHSTALAASANADNYYRLGEAWLAAAPNGRSISFRRPLYFIHWASRRYGLQLDEATLGQKAEQLAAIGGDITRVGCYNDGYLGSSSDLGTFDADNRASVTDWLSVWAQTTFYGGEAVANSSGGTVGEYNSVSYITEEAYKTHTHYLNIDWNDRLIDAWRQTAYTGDDEVYASATGYTYIANHLGYRLVLRNSSLSRSVVQGGILKLTGRIGNVGFGNVINRKKATVIFVNTTDETSKYSAEVNFDIRKCGSQSSSEYEFLMRVPDRAPSGSYGVYIRFADPLEADTSQMRGIKLANRGNVYKYGANYLGATSVSANAQASGHDRFEQIEDGGELKATLTFTGGAQATGELAPVTVAEGESVILPQNTFVRPHYEFIGWSDGTRTYQSGESYEASGNAEFTALWQIVSYTVKFDGSGGTLVSGKAEQTVRYGSAAVSPVYEKEGYKFVGWDKQFDSVAGDTVVTALWEKETAPVVTKGCFGGVGAASFCGAAALIAAAITAVGFKRKSM